ncbi:hypothetical protein [Nocardiopsis metallicus]|uniref:Uncharacterized protein n=1 Tax=Nocardiopsis metallicus TaxID=179819 RepID=A0A840WJY1_9ACTN|nr:hypothetical protein [Nocardiopsis metallicus]MBB5492165.1 hypothetical protein [Nocardiopsis metallicus]
MAWVVIVEESVNYGQSARWGVGTVRGDHADREEARSAALAMTRTFAPNHPWSERDRQVFRNSEDSYLVNVVGATTEFHFRVSVAERI